MKSLLKRFVSRAVSNDRIWAWLDATLMQAARFAEWERKKNLPDPLELERARVIQEHFSDLTVRHGPFSGLRFTQAMAATGSILPKLLGTYEIELQPLLEEICHTDYHQVLNIGSGEGYYAIGLALRLPQANIFAWDTSVDARSQLQAMASFNGVSERVQCDASCSSQTLANFPFSGRSLVLSDCEGFEKQLFEPQSVQALKPHDVLIEVHDFVDMDISTHLKRVFDTTHHLQIIPAIGDIKRAVQCDYAEMAGFEKEQRKRLMSEDRNYEMEWFWFTPRR